MNNEDQIEIPTVVVEVGYREPVNDLEKDANDWLCMQDGEVPKVSNNGSYSSFNDCFPQVNLVILLRAFPDSDRFRGELWKRDASGQPIRFWDKDLKPNDLDTTTAIPMEIQLADLYDNNIPAFLEGTGPIILDLKELAFDARDAKRMMQIEAGKRKKAFDESDRESKKAKH